MEENKKPKIPSNDNIKSIVSKPPERKKSNPFGGFISDIITDDIPSIFEYIVRDVAIPTTVGCLQQSAHAFISMLFRMDPGTGYRTGGYYGADEYWNRSIKNDYSKYYRGDDRPLRPGAPPPWAEKKPDSGYFTNPEHDYMDYPIRDYATAQQVLTQMRDTLSYYDAISVANFYKIVNYRYPDNWAHNKSTLHSMGWFDLSNVTIATRGTSRGVYYYLTLPQAVYIGS